MEPELEVRLVEALEGIAFQFARWCTIAETRLAHEYPTKPVPRDARVTRLPTAEEKLRAEQGQTNEPLADWMRIEPDIGPREREIVERSKTEKEKRKAGST